MPASRRSRILLLALPLFLLSALGLLEVLVAVRLLGDYGLVLFICHPMALGMATAAAIGWREPRTFWECCGYGSMTCAAVMLGLLALGAEGVICLLMAAPLVLPLMLAGCAVGYHIQRGPSDPHRRRRILTLLTVAGSLPLLMGMEAAWRGPAPERMVESRLTIPASAELIWPVLLAFPPIPPPDEWVFRAGIAHPTHARLYTDPDGRLIRECHFDTGPFIEPVTAMEEPHRLAFDVASQPPPMQHRNPFGTHLPKLDPYLRSQRGELVLEPLPDGSTDLIGRTWYRLEAWPQWYWTLWSDHLIGLIHKRVLDHIANCTTGPAPTD